jgi:hypothetical protein
MKLTHLNTLPKRIDEIESLFINNKINSTKWRHLVMEHIDFLNEIVHIGLFVAAKDGKPLKEPTYTKSDGNFEGSFEYQKSIILYKKAQQEVIFEGWEVRLDSNSDIVIRNGDLRLVFIRITDEKHLSIALYRKKESLGRVQSLSDLADATQSNPLKLK